MYTKLVEALKTLSSWIISKILSCLLRSDDRVVSKEGIVFKIENIEE